MIGRLSSKAQRYEFQAKFEFDRIWSIRYLVGLTHLPQDYCKGHKTVWPATTNTSNMPLRMIHIIHIAGVIVSSLKSNNDQFCISNKLYS